MSELEPQLHGNEHLKGAENSAEQQEKLQKLMDEAREARNEHAESAETLRHTVEQEAVTGKELQGKISEKEKPHHSEDQYITKARKKAAYKKLLQHEQKKLSKPERSFSKVIHQPIVEKVSDIGAKTVARPSGILAGGICALVGTSFVFYMAKHYGFRYNFFIFFALLIIGFVVGLFLELIWSGAKKLKSH